MRKFIRLAEHHRDKEKTGRVGSARQALRNEIERLLEVRSSSMTQVVAVDAHGEKRVADQLEVFDHLTSTQSPAVTKNPAGFLRTSIEKDFAPPTDYVSRAERQRRKQEEEEDEVRRRQADELKKAEEARTQRKDQLDALWTSLTASERAQLEADGLARLNSFALKKYAKEKAEGRIGSAHQALRNEIEQLLEVRLSSMAQAAAMAEDARA